MMRPISACDFPALSSLAILSRNSLSTFLPRGMLCAPKYTAMIADRLSCPRGEYYCLVSPVLGASVTVSREAVTGHCESHSRTKEDK